MLRDQLATHAPAAEGWIHGGVPDDGEAVPAFALAQARVLVHQDLPGELPVGMGQPGGMLRLAEISLGIVRFDAVIFDIRLNGLHGAVGAPVFGVQA
jgi:hypothetical protein